MSTIIIGDVAEGAKWWSQAAFYKIELARLYKQNNAFMQYWKFPAADVKIHVIMRAGQPVAFIYVENNIRVCWRLLTTTEKGTQFVQKTGATKDEVDYYAMANTWRNTNYGQGYWINTAKSQAISTGGAIIFYKGARYLLPTAFSTTEHKSLLATMFFKSIPLLLYYQTSVSNNNVDFFLHFGTITPPLSVDSFGSVSLAVTPINLSVDNPGILYAALGGDDLLWIISRVDSLDVVSSDPDIFIRAYRISTITVDDEVIPAVTLLHSYTVSGCMFNNNGSTTGSNGPHIDYYIHNDPFAPIFVESSNNPSVSNSSVITNNNVISEVFVQHNKLSLAFRSTSSTVTQSQITAAPVFDGAGGNPAGIFIENAPGLTLNKTVLSTVGLRVTVFTLTKNELTSAETITAEDVYVESFTERNFATERLTNDYLRNFSPNPAAAVDHKRELRYADGINKTYVINDRDGTAGTRRNILYRGNTVIDDLPSTSHTTSSESLTYTSTFVPVPDTNVSLSSNGTLISSSQGYYGAFDGETYLLQVNNDIAPLATSFAFSGNAVVKRIDATKRTTTVGILP